MVFCCQSYDRSSCCQHGKSWSCKSSVLCILSSCNPSKCYQTINSSTKALLSTVNGDLNFEFRCWNLTSIRATINSLQFTNELRYIRRDGRFWITSSSLCYQDDWQSPSNYRYFCIGQRYLEKRFCFSQRWFQRVFSSKKSSIAGILAAAKQVK